MGRDATDRCTPPAEESDPQLDDIGESFEELAREADARGVRIYNGPIDAAAVLAAAAGAGALGVMREVIRQAGETGRERLRQEGETQRAVIRAVFRDTAESSDPTCASQPATPTEE